MPDDEFYDSVMDAMHRIADEKDTDVLKVEDYVNNRKEDEPLYSAIEFYFRTWNNAVSEAGLDSGGPSHNNIPYIRGWNHDKIVMAYQEFYAKENDYPQVDDLSETEYLPSLKTVQQLFGSHRYALKSSDMQTFGPREKVRKWEEKLSIYVDWDSGKDLEDICDKYDMNRDSARRIVSEVQNAFLF